MSKAAYEPLPTEGETGQAPPPAYEEVPTMKPGSAAAGPSAMDLEAGRSGDSDEQQQEVAGDEEQDWDIGLFGCMPNHKADFCLACWVPSAAYGILSSRLQHVAETGMPHPTRGTVVNAQTIGHFIVDAADGLASGMGLHIPVGLIARAMDWRLRTDTRATLRVRGSHFKDALAVFCCNPCMFAQQSAQLDRAERERAHQLEGPESTPQVIVSEPEPVVMPLAPQ